MELTNTKQIHEAYKRYRNSSATTLCDVYGSYSSAKARAYDYCLDLYRKYNGRGFRIVSANAMTFSVGFEFIDNDGVACFCWITKDYDRYMKITSEDL